MKKLVLAALSSVALSACGGLSPQAACENLVDPTCEKMWNCPGAVLKVGSDLASCKTQYKSLCALATSCNDGKTFDSSAASACPNDIKAQTCEQYASGEPTSCQNVCK